MGSDRAVRKQRGGSVLGMDWEKTIRERIQSSKVANRLIEFVLGEITLEPAQVTAALGLLKKVLPDLSQSDNKTELIHRYVARLPAKAKSTEEWQKQHPQPNTIQ